MFDYVDEIVAALVLGIAASYVVREFMGWRSAKPQRDIENLTARPAHSDNHLR
jgi:flagellar biogenesis protein FliO